MKYTFIYCLLDPRTGKPRYVGKSNKPKKRVQNHCNPARYKPTHKFNWIKELRNNNLKPIIVILEKVPIDIWKEREKHWIRYLRKKGFKLTNYTDGGDGLSFGNQTSFKKGNIPWNKGTAKPKILKGNRGKTLNSKRNHFKKGFTPWNKNNPGYTTKKRKPILQFDLENNFIKEFSSCKEAAQEMNCIPENIRRVCVGKSKTARGYIWKYKHETKN